MSYKVPKRDLQFVLHDVLNIGEHYQRLDNEDVNAELVDTIIDAAASLCEEVIAPTNAAGDRQGCTLNGGVVTTPQGFKDAYQHYVDGGWTGLAFPEQYGGQGLPSSLAMVVQEMVDTANWSFSMYPHLSQGAIRCLIAEASDQIKQDYATKLISGEWTGTMCLTEPHCGSDLGLLRTKAVANADGSYAITGTKIFISSGEHDLADNIIHLCLARIDGAPAGTKGISLFVVPKIGLDGQRNGVVCSALEEKMGIHGNATCAMNFDAANGFLVGEENRGLQAMFVMMNAARLGTAMQGIAHSEQALQASLNYAKERLQMRSLTGPKNPDGPADPLMVHPDVRRMLLHQKAFTEGGRCLVHWLAQLQDIAMTDHSDAGTAGVLMETITPIAKAFMTELGFESTNLGMQVFGGHGYTRDYGVEQHVRDARIAMIYEGTTGIQALDLLGRKVLASRGNNLKPLLGEVAELQKHYKRHDVVGPMLKRLSSATAKLKNLTLKIGLAARGNRDEIGAASVDYLMYCGYIVFGLMWVKMALAASTKLAEAEADAAFYEAKIATAKFYFARLFPRIRTHEICMRAGADTLMSLDAEAF